MIIEQSSFNTNAIARLIKRRHPQYNALLPHWKFMASCYYGGPGWFKDNIFRYMKEGDNEYSDRVKRAYRFNHTREVVDLVNKYLFRSKPDRNREDASEELVAFWEKATVNGLSIDEFARAISKQASIYGRCWVVVDNDVELTEDGEAVSQALAEKSDAGIYSYLVTPEHVLDMSYDDIGILNWVLIREVIRDDANPLECSGNMTYRYRLWTREQWFVFEPTNKQSRACTEAELPVAVVSQPSFRENIDNLELTGSGSHNLGVVPVIPVDNTICDDLYDSPALIADVAYLDRACANYSSNLDAIIQDQTFSQLAMPAQGLMPGDDEYEKLLEVGTKRIFIYDGESGAQPFFLSPDPRQAALISSAINQIIGEIYHSVGLGVERAKDTSTENTDKASGVAKTKDFERVTALLSSKSDSMEQVENKIAAVVSLWSGNKIPEEELVKYPRTFDIRELYDEFYIANQLALVQMPPTARGEQMKSMLEKLFPQLGKDLKDRMVKEIDDWTVMEEKRVERQDEMQEQSLVAMNSEQSAITEEAKRNREVAGVRQSESKTTDNKGQENDS
ncbi:conserved hypothetical protein [Vibrio coralliirubri]|uniref:phage portal protein n=1 Tax=Vibrio coralliirubri TaxID=1516159 RepID=UPI0006362FA2|nr:hypothetical protein [Vibrio coralliirubri]CDT52724.1 conserved hypothetical protein [Vibrio coralliirubri]